MAKKRTSGVEREERFITIKWGGVYDGEKDQVTWVKDDIRRREKADEEKSKGRGKERGKWFCNSYLGICAWTTCETY